VELFTITLMEKDQDGLKKLCSFLEKELAPLAEKGENISVKYEEYHEYKMIRCLGNLKITSISETMELIRYRMSSALSDYILDVKEKAMIASLMDSQYYYRDPKDVEKIEKYAFQLLNEGDFEDPSLDYRFNRKNKLFHKIFAYLSEHTSINVDGFVDFRLPDYRKDLMDVVDHAIDEYILDKEYQEFISLLRYFVLVQDPKMQEIHVYHSDNEFQLMHKDFSPLQMEEIDLFVNGLADQDIQFEDMIVSTLISASPEKIVMHTMDVEHNVIKTITQIFEGRIVLCSSCERCREKQQRSELPPISTKNH
jgi:putative sporulation protein YtxC